MVADEVTIISNGVVGYHGDVKKDEDLEKILRKRTLSNPTGKVLKPDAKENIIGSKKKAWLSWKSKKTMGNCSFGTFKNLVESHKA